MMIEKDTCIKEELLLLLQKWVKEEDVVSIAWPAGSGRQLCIQLNPQEGEFDE